MQIGVVLPQTEIGVGPQGLRDYTQAAEELGFKHVLAYDHVLGANTAGRTDRSGPYNHTNMFHEPLVLFGFLAGITTTIEFVTGILIMPQRQTALIAKQAAEVDILSNGRFRLGIGIGWNKVEYDSLGQDFHVRGKRSEEQIALLRALWTNDLVTFDGKWDKIDDAGLNPLPVQRPIPIWFGGMADPVIKRVGELGDGWFPQFSVKDPDWVNQPIQGRGVTPKELVRQMQAHAEAAGRNPSDIGIEGRITLGDRGPADWQAEFKAWRELGATYMSVNTMGSGFASVDAHIDGIRRFKDAVSGL